MFPLAMMRVTLAFGSKPARSVLLRVTGAIDARSATTATCWAKARSVASKQESMMNAVRKGTPSGRLRWFHEIMAMLRMPSAKQLGVLALAFNQRKRSAAVRVVTPAS